MNRFRRCLGLLLIAALALIVPVGGAVANVAKNPQAVPRVIIAPAPIDVKLFGHPSVYCEAPKPDGENYHHFDTLTGFNAQSTFGDVRPSLPAPREVLGYKFSHYSKSNGGTGPLSWQDADSFVRDNGSVRSVYYAYTMMHALQYETNGADNAGDPAFAAYTAEDNSNAEKVRIPAVVPVRSNAEEGRSGDTFLGWYEDAEATKKLTATRSLRMLWEAQGAPYIPFTDPCERNVKLATAYAGWDEAPLLAVQDQTIVAGDAFDLNSLVASVTDKEDDAAGLDVAVTFAGDYDVNTPGDYPITVTATDSAGGTHTLTATLTVLMKAPVVNEAPVLEVQDVTIVAGEPFKVEDVFVSVSDKEDDAAGLDVAVTFAGDFDVNTPGDYPITVTATDSGGAKATKVATLTVLMKAPVLNEAPVLEVQDVTIVAGEPFKVEDVFVSVSDKEDDAAGLGVEVTYTGDFDINTPGDYPITVTATDSGGAKATKVATLTVLMKAPVLNEAPVLEVQDVTIVAGEPFKVEDVFVSVSDKEDDAAGLGVEVTYTGDFDINTPGDYPITVTATDSDGAKNTKVATLTVVAGEDPVPPVEPGDPVEPEPTPTDPSKPAPVDPGTSVKPPAKPGQTDVPAPQQPKLPHTGADVAGLVLLSAGLMTAGAALLVSRRKFR